MQNFATIFLVAVGLCAFPGSPAVESAALPSASANPRDNPVVSAKTEEPIHWHYLTTEMASSITQGWLETRTNLSIGGRPIRIAGQRYDKGLGTHPPGEMVFLLNGKHKRLVAEVGVDDDAPKMGSVSFKVLLDGKFQDKMHRIQRELPAWVQQSGQQAQATRLTQELTALMKDRKWQEADKVADELLSLMSQGEKK